MSKALLAFVGDEQARVAALSGGDDYVLAFTLPPAQLAPLLGDGWPIQVIGRVEAGQGVTLLDANGFRQCRLIHPQYCPSNCDRVSNIAAHRLITSSYIL